MIVHTFRELTPTAMDSFTEITYGNGYTIPFSITGNPYILSIIPCKCIGALERKHLARLI